MKMLALALSLATLAATGPAAAADVVLDSIAWKSAPTRAEVDAAFPAAAVGKIDRVDVDLRCKLQDDGALTACKSVMNTRTDHRFDVAAQALASHFVAYVPKSVLSSKDNTLAFVSFSFRDPSRRSGPSDLLDPELLHVVGSTPAAGEFPQAAATAGVQAGVGIVDCVSGHDGALTGCAVSSETPAGDGFGQAAIKMAQAMRLNPWQGGGPVEGTTFRLPIYIYAPGVADPTFQRQAVFHVPRGWTGTAGPYFPDRAMRMGVKGAAVIQCILLASGALNNCTPVSETVADMGFLPASLIMARQGAITAAPRIIGGHPLASEVVQVLVPFTF